MKCEKCGTDIKKDDKFCSKCGSKVKIETITMKKTPKGFILVSMIFGIMLGLFLLYLNFGRVGEFTGILVIVLIAIFWIFNFVKLIYFYAKKYETHAKMLSIANIIFYPILTFISYFSTAMLVVTIISIMCLMAIIGYCLYLLWKE